MPEEPFRGNEAVERGPATPETGTERPETTAGFELPRPATEAEVEAAPPSASAPVSVPTRPALKDEVIRSVESVLEEGLADTYRAMPAAAKVRFRREGERVTVILSEMIRTFRVSASKALKLIRGWLSLIPGVSAVFLTQESKIKTDRILALAEERKKKKGIS